MNDEDRNKLRQAADAGNVIAERLLLNDLLAADGRDEIEQLLQRKATREDPASASFLRAELCCFHAYPGEDWAARLQACCEEGHKEALFVASMYHDWSGHSDAAEQFGRMLNGETPNPDVALWSGGWNGWERPSWEVVAEQDGVTISRSSAFASRWLIGFLRSLLGPRLRPSAVVDPQSGRTVAHPVRINRVAQWLPEHLGWVGKLFECRLAEAAGYDVGAGEVLSLLHYQPGQRYKPHLDCLGIKQTATEEGQREGGQRTTTVLFSMGNDDYVGGETRFPKLDLNVRCNTGEIIRFNSTDSDNKPLPASLHEGTPIVSGEKWLLSKWVREMSTPYGRETAIVCPAG